MGDIFGGGLYYSKTNWSDVMSSFKKHIIVSLAFLGALFLGREYLSLINFDYSISTMGILVAITIVSSLIPDLDMVNSKLRKIVDVVGLILIVYFIIAQSYFLALIILAFLLFLYTLKHRGFMHRILTGFILSLPIFYFSRGIYGVGFLVGFLSHLLID